MSNRLPSDFIVDLNDSTPAFKLAFREYQLGRYAPLRAYTGQIDGLSWGPCYACDQIGFIQNSGLQGKTCSNCELEIDSVQEARQKAHGAIDEALSTLIECFRPSVEENNATEGESPSENGAGS